VFSAAAALCSRLRRESLAELTTAVAGALTSNSPFGRVVEPGFLSVGGSNFGLQSLGAGNRFSIQLLAPRDGLEPPTNGLTVAFVAF